jgi:uncharacterized damage-inducible protein DinB
MAPTNADGSDLSASVPPSLRVPRPDETDPTDELTMLRGWLMHLRGSASSKAEGLSGDQLRWTPTPTANSVGGILVHLGYAERWWVRAIFAGESMDLAWTADRFAATFEVPSGWGAEDVMRFYAAETAAADAVLDRSDDPAARSRADQRPTTLRWVLTHLVEETARHAGHLDITRELIDGQIGR